MRVVLLAYNPTPLIEVTTPETVRAGIQLLIKREDLNHPFVSGNKWWKLKYNLQAAQEQGYRTLLTVGGAYSNHIYATAAAARELGFQSIGIIRGEETLPLNATLSFAKSNGMQLHYLSREAYRRKNETEFIQSLHNRFGEFYFIPEGGTNPFAVKGIAEFAHQLQQQASFDYVCLPVGTGGTLAGLVEGLPNKHIVGFAALKGGDFLSEEVKLYTAHRNSEIETAFHFGGYGKVTEELLHFIHQFSKEHNVPLDPVYTGKALFGVLQKVREGFLRKGAKVLFLHTGGLQGNAGFDMPSNS